MEQKKNKKIYLSGKITGDENYKVKFGEYEKALKDKGYDVVNPTLLSKYDSFFNYEDFMTVDYAFIKVCDCIAMIPDWIESSGAMRELNMAKSLGKEVIYL